MTPSPSNRTVSANPTKAFFVSMITRDITLEDSILDLIDNSVDGAWRREGNFPIGLDTGPDLSAYKISICASPTCFIIRDNCGGMTVEEAADHAFSFGRKAADHPHQYSIGVYGIGMKRAAFKLGTNIRVTSTYTDSSGVSQTFSVPIAVQEWLNDDEPPWDFAISSAESLDDEGVEIVVDKLTDDAASSFDNQRFLQDLRRTIARDYSLHLLRGLKIEVNGRSVDGLPIELRKSDEFAPMRVAYHDQVGDDDVSVEIIGGMTAPPPDTSDPDERDKAERTHGWYIACNARIVLAADKTAVAGWGTPDWPQWHYQYSGFIGIVLFTASNAGALPLTTTKRSVDQSSGVFLRARVKMRELSKRWIAYTHERKRALDEAKEKEAAAQRIALHQVQRRVTPVLPKLTRAPAERRANVGYSVPLSKLRRLAREFGDPGMAYRDVGIESFRYAYDELVGED